VTILPDGRTASFAESSERAAKMEMQRLTEAYLARVRALYPDLSPQDKLRVVVAMRDLKAAVLPHWMQGKVRRER
jgi:hypothetical protein